jgi:hypothetical protein
MPLVRPERYRSVAKGTAAPPWGRGLSRRP